LGLSPDIERVRIEHRIQQGADMSASREAMRSYIASLPVGALPRLMSEEGGAVNSIDIDKLPTGLVTGSNLIQFAPDVAAPIKSSVTLSLLAAQRVASNDPVVLTPDQWVERHNTVLKNLNWHDDGGGTVNSEFDSINVAVHEAILPFLTAALGGAVAAGALILTALQQLQAMDKDAPWITLFDKQSRRFDVTEYQFTVVEVDKPNNVVRLSLAAARLNADYGRTQVLFFKLTKQRAKFEQASQKFSADVDLLADMNADLKVKLGALTKSFIRSLPDDLLVGAGAG
jgi:hypothetical protein